MPSTFQSPRNPLAAMWASSVESYLRNQHPELTITQIRRLPMMQGVYEHLYQLKRKSRVEKPMGTETGEALAIAQNAYLSQEFFDLAVTTAAFATTGDQAYEKYISLVNSYNDSHDIADFSTSDLAGFALCLIMWLGYTGMNSLTTMERNYLNYLISQLPLTAEQRQKVMDAWEQAFGGVYSVQYRDANDYKSYQAIPWQIPAGAQIVMLGDWGTSLDDAHAFLYTIWKKAFLNNPKAPVVFLHLGDIYYTGLTYECQHYFYDVFVTVGQKLKTDLNDSNFNAYPPIFTLPGNHEYYSYGYGYFALLDELNKQVPNIPHAQLYQQCSFFCLQTADKKWQFLGMDTGQADGNALLSLLQDLGDKVIEWAMSQLPDWDWLNWVSGLVQSTYEDYVGPFQPTLRPNEVTWLKDKLDTFSGKTIMLSHHQLFSREAKINHSNPEYMNIWLDKTFSSYYKSKIAAWYWGHEHSFATYLDGLMGLNKGRLLGSSSYEATQEDDTPYANNYPMIPLGTNMNANSIHSLNGLYYHAGAILSQNGTSMNVSYYQFPAWSQLDSPPADPQLIDITGVDETITTTFKSLKSSWIGGLAIQDPSQNNLITDHIPSLASWKDDVYLVFSDAHNGTNRLAISYTNASAFRPATANAAPNWTAPQQVILNSQTVVAPHGPVSIIVNGTLYIFYLDGKGYIQGISATADQYQNRGAWSSIGNLPVVVQDAKPAICLFQGRIYIVYMQTGSDNNMGWGYYDITAKSWHDLGALKDSTGKQFQGSGAIALAADPWHLYMTFEEKGGNKISWAVGAPSGPVPNGTANNISWTNKGHINIATQDGTTTPTATIGMTLNYSDGVFFLIYVSTSNHYLVQCVLYGTDKMNTGTWLGKYQVIVSANTSKPHNTCSSKAPTLAIADGGGFLVFRGDSNNSIYWTYY